MNWDDLSGKPLAPDTGPFPSRRFLQVCADRSTDPVVVVSGSKSAAAVTVSEDAVRFVGEHHLTDYHSPLGSDMDELVALLADLEPLSFDLDSLPLEAADPLAEAFGAAGMTATRLDDEACQVIRLGDAPADGWEAMLPSKGRHELRRKRRRYVAARGEPTLLTGPEHFGEFVALHRASAGEKGDFMTAEMESFFADLLSSVGARLDVLHHGSAIVAAAFGFDDERGYYLYNSAFDPSLADLSPGIILIDALIARSVERGLQRFDFLKGGEVYKRRLGAEPRPLFRLKVAR